MADAAYVEELEPQDTVDEPDDKSGRLEQFADASGDISDQLDERELADLGTRAVSEWKADNESRESWVQSVKQSFDRAAQETVGEQGASSAGVNQGGTAKTYPFEGASDIDYPLLTTASQQFSARAYPAIVKGDEAVGMKVLGDPPPSLDPKLPPEAQQAIAQMTMNWVKKKARAERVKRYLNYLIFYSMDNWEDETDTLLSQLPVCGTVFRKVHWKGGKVCSDYVNPLRFTVDINTKDLATCPRMTHDFDLYPYQIKLRQRAGLYRDVELPATDTEDEQKSRVILEQHRLIDLDDDGVEEPYIVTIDAETEKVLRIEADYTQDDVILKDGKVVEIKRWVPFVKYPFLRDPKGRFYELGFGQLLGPLTDVINTTINELLDAGTAANAGGGFFSGGLRIQGAGQLSTVLFKPGEYKVVSAPPGQLQGSIWERPVPQPSPTLFNLLEFILGAAKDIASVKDVITGDAPANAPVGTTLALIEQGLQVFTSIYKRIYRSLKEEFRLIYECEARYGGERSAKEYLEVLDDPEADFEADFSQSGHDIQPISDPTVVTTAQALAKASVLQQFIGIPGVNTPEILRRIFEAAQIPDPESLISAPAPDPMAAAEVEKTKSETEKNRATALNQTAQAGEKVGGIDAGDIGRLRGLAGEPGNAMGDGPMPQGGGGPEGGLGASDMGLGGSPGGPPVSADAQDASGLLPGPGPTDV